MKTKHMIAAGLLVVCMASMYGFAHSKGNKTMDIREQVSTVGITIDQEGIKPEVLYTTNINTQTIICSSRFNSIELFNNMGFSSGTIASGYNPTAYLEPGKNTLELAVVPIGVNDDILDYGVEDSCSITLSGAFPDGKQVEISSLNITTEDGKLTTKTSTIYPDEHKTPLSDTEGTVRGWITKFTRPIHIKTIPRWRWVDATPIREDNHSQMKALYRAYASLIELMEEKDFEGLKMAYSLSSREKAKAEAYFSEPDDFYIAAGFEERFERWEDAQAEPRREWHEYELRSYLGGRLVQLADKRSHSPLRIGSVKEDLIYSPTPLFSMIEGRVVIAR